MKANSPLSISGNTSYYQHSMLAVAMFFLSMLFLPVGLKAQVAQPTITANADLNNLVCGQTVTLTASGTADEYYWYSNAACTDLLGTGQTYTFTVGDQPITIYCKAGLVTTPATPDAANFLYTGGQQTFTVPNGVYEVQLQVWGAQGGYRSSSSYGGMGGYSVGMESNGAYSLPIATASTKVLKEAMAQAVANENYEFAARLRDEINSRSHSDETDSDLI